MKLVLAEKPSVAQSIAKVLGANERFDGYLEGNGYVVSWCVGHLVELFEPEGYDERYSKWNYNDLPIVPDEWKYQVSAGTRKQFGVLRQLMKRDDVQSLVCATDAGREGELIFRLVYHQCRCKKPFERLWISSMEDSAIREGFANLKQSKEYDIEDGKVSTVIVKDMSRVGRDYLQVGFYTEVMFREKGVHFIAISNGVDSNKRESAEFAPSGMCVIRAGRLQAY